MEQQLSGTTEKQVASAYIMLIPTQGMGLVMLANASGFEQIDQVDQMARNVYSMLNGKTPTPISLSFASIFLHWLVLLTPWLQILGIVIVWRKQQVFKGCGVLLTVFLNIALVLLPLGLSQLIPFPLPSLVVMYPDIGYGLIVVATLGIGWSVIYMAMSLMERRSK